MFVDRKYEAMEMTQKALEIYELTLVSPPSLLCAAHCMTTQTSDHPSTQDVKDILDHILSLTEEDDEEGGNKGYYQQDEEDQQEEEDQQDEER